MWKTLGSIGTPVLLMPLLLGHLGFSARGAVARRRAAVGMAAAGVVAAGWLVLGRGGPFLGIEAIVPGLVVSVVVFLVGVKWER